MPVSTRHHCDVSRLIRSTCLVLCLALAAPALADPTERYPEADEIRTLLDAEPDGVLFTVREYDEDALSWVLPRLEHYIRQLHERHPDMPIAVLSHGNEMLSLTRDNRTRYPDLHAALFRWVSDFDIAFHVCATFAAHHERYEEDFPDYIDFVPSGPAQINDYRAVGFEVIELELTW